MTNDDSPTYYANGEVVEVHGAKLDRGTTADGTVYPDLTHLVIRFPDTVHTREVPPGAIKVEGGLSAMMDDLAERGIVPQWFADGERLPPEHPDRDDGPDGLVDNWGEVSGLSPSEAQNLVAAGYVTVADLRDASVDEIAAVGGIGDTLATRIKADVGDNDE